MPLTLNQFLFLILTIAAVVAVTAFISFLLQLKKTAKEGEKTLIEVQTLSKNLNEVSQKVNEKIDDLGDVVDATKKMTAGLSEATWFLVTKIIRPGSKLLPFLFPIIRMGWRQLKKNKEVKNGQ
jgi:ABC-type transporter Mla subunit MlaD